MSFPGESQGWGSLVGFHLWGRTESGHNWSDLAAAATLLPPFYCFGGQEGGREHKTKYFQSSLFSLYRKYVKYFKNTWNSYWICIVLAMRIQSSSCFVLLMWLFSCGSMESIAGLPEVEWGDKRFLFFCFPSFLGCKRCRQCNPQRKKIQVYSHLVLSELETRSKTYFYIKT